MYRNYFQQSVATLTQELAKIDAEVAGLSERIASFPVFPNTDCIEELRYMMRHRACGSHGDGDCYSGDVTFTAVSYNSTLELQENGLAQFLIAASDLGAAGVKISEALESARVPRWNYSRETSRKYFSAVDREPPAYREYIERIGARQCAPGRTAQVAGFYGIQDEVKRAADDLRVRTIVNNHLLLAASEALRSCTTIAERVSAVQV